MVLGAPSPISLALLSSSLCMGQLWGSLLVYTRVRVAPCTLLTRNIPTSSQRPPVPRRHRFGVSAGEGRMRGSPALTPHKTALSLVCV